ncbi:uncharacterized protein K452DRAFT_344777 [Aplosporella prunicola CBS 121167]|uniref:WSC domain-containing protein n=1 Tax=Aplosporella prunicola CBS 121167 TaxID=1176127 RepID=A0A6A6BKU1_9PEZI|nr:uncharacterized protein K452DRAFT_344777 [Aplosporella prunicola CBS 121167]KAF2144740.1 hypothetical protein K452DRAFT_344777 [Aplosporella prunicola CBS 121167]
MVSSFFTAALAAASLFSAVYADPMPNPVAAPNPDSVKSQTSTPTYTGALHSMTYKGCFDSSEPLEDQGEYTYQTQGNCQPVCVGLGNSVMALVNGTNCYCGNKLPAKSSRQSNDDKCDTPCNGFDKDNCGGNNYWQVYLTGINNNDVDYYDGGSSTSSGLSTSTSMSQGTPVLVTVSAGSTVIVTQGPSSDSGKSSGSSSTAGIAAGVVVGVVVLASIVGGVFLYLRHKRRKEIEDEHRARQSVNNFVATGKHPNAHSINDNILDPTFARRMSNGSVADNQDYSRRILQVRNPDDD